MRIAICTVSTKPFVRIWSGTPAHLAEAMQSRTDVETIVLERPAPIAYDILNAASVISGRMGDKFNWEVEPRALQYMTSRLRRQWQRTKPDVAIFMGWLPFALEPDDPAIIYWGDAPIAPRVGESPHWTRLSKRTSSLVRRIEPEAVALLDGVFMPSEWAIRAFASEYQASTAHFYRVPFGANVDDPGRRLKRLGPPPHRLLAVGVEWHRKGLDVAVSALDELTQSGLDVRLDVVGALPPDESWNRPNVTYHGFLGKSDPAEYAMLRNLYGDADLFILPSRSDPSPMVLGEAGAYSVPVIASAVDGIPERVVNGGVLLPRESTPAAYARAVREMLREGSYDEYSAGSRADYETISDWAATAGLVVEYSREIFERKAASRRERAN